MTSTTDQRHIGDDRGFSLMEVMVAVAILSVAILGVVASMDHFRASATRSETREAATHRAEQEIEALRGAGYKALIMKTNPGSSTNPNDPRYYVSGTNYKPSADAQAQPMVLDDPAAADPDALDPAVAWSSGDVSGTVYRFITKDPDTTGTTCVQICPRRVTVAVTVESPSGTVRSKVVMSTLVIDPQDVGTDENATPNPTSQQCPCWTTMFATDSPVFTPTTPPTPPIPAWTRQAPTQHAKRDWVHFPDMLAVEPPLTDASGLDPTLYRYTTDMAGTYTPAGYPGGRVIKQSGGCDSDGGNDKSMRWTTKAVTTAQGQITLTGNASFTIYSQTAGGGAGLGWLCLQAWKWKIQPDGEQKNGVKIGHFGCSQNPWPQTPEPITCAGNFGTTTLDPDWSLGLEVTVWDASALDAVIIYDHPQYPSVLSWESNVTKPPGES